MKIVKLSYPKGWDGDYKAQFPNADCIWGEYKFEINNNITECDIWVVHESVDVKESVLCPKENVFFITSEEKQQKEFYSEKYIAQFSKIITTRDDIIHPNIIRTHYISPWHLKKNYTELKSIEKIEKLLDLSTITSDFAGTAGHKKRYAFINRLKGHFKDNLTWFGKGEQFINDKWDGLKHFKYSIAIENSSTPYYWTEKIADCYLSLTMPIYYGCPNIANYFPKESFIQLEIDNYKSSIEKIEQALVENWYQKNIEYIKQAKNLILDKYQFVPALVNLLGDSCTNSSDKKCKITIKPEKAFIKNSLDRRIIRKIRKDLNRIFSI